MEFDSERYGVQIVPFILGDDAVEPHYSVVFRLNNLRRTSADEVEVTRGLPGDQTRNVLVALRDTCERAITMLDAHERAWADRTR